MSAPSRAYFQTLATRLGRRRSALPATLGGSRPKLSGSPTKNHLKIFPGCGMLSLETLFITLFPVV